jgi:hypothetical protein
MMKNLTSKVYPIFFVVLLLGLAGLGLGLSRFTITIETESPDSSLPAIDPPVEPAVSKVETLTPGLPSVSPDLPTPVASPSTSPDPVALAAGQGTLRVSNRTDRPVRVALLTRQAKPKTNGQPAHWDFAPMEGSRQGLLLSLPQGNLKLSKGDILVAFAQDGSRQYWGPYVLGETPMPIWSGQQGEWQLVLQP